MTTRKLQGKVALITGAASGIGEGTAKKFAEHGAILALLDLDRENLERVAKECHIIGKQFSNPEPHLVFGDVGSEKVRQEYVESAYKTFGHIDILVNNAAIEIPCSVLSSPLEIFDKILGINLRAPYDLCRLSSKYLIESKGNIVNITSVNSYAVVSQNPAYCTAKAGLKHLTKCLSDEFGPFQVRVNSMSPGAIRTNIWKGLNFTAEETDKNYALLSEHTVIDRVGSPEEMANVIAFLASDDASYITGSDILADGGFLSKHMFR